MPHITKRQKSLLLSLSCLICIAANANQLDFNHLTQQKIRHQLSINNTVDINAIMTQHSQELNDLAVKSPEEKRAATVYFNHGLSTKELASLLQYKSIIPIDTEAQVYLPKTKTTLTVWFKNIQSHGKTVTDALASFEALHRKEATKNKAKRNNQDDNDVEYDIYKMRKNLKYTELSIIGTNQDLAALSNHTLLVNMVLVGNTVIQDNLVPDLSNNVPPSITQSQLNGIYDGVINTPNTPSQPLIICGPLAGVGEKNCPPDLNWVPSPG